MEDALKLILICLLFIKCPAVYAFCYFNENNSKQVSTPVITENVFDPLCTNPDIYEKLRSYVDSLLAQNKTKEAYWVVKNNHLENTIEGYIVIGDMAILDKDYQTAVKNYKNAIELDPENLILQSNLAQAYRLLGYLNTSTKLYCEILNKDPNNIHAKLGLGYLEIDRKNFAKSRDIFCDILAKQSDYKPAKIGIIHSYLANGDSLKALEILKKISPDADVKLLKAQTYYSIGMYSDALKNVPSKHECELCESKKTGKVKKNKNKTKVKTKVSGIESAATGEPKSTIQPEFIEKKTEEIVPEKSRIVSEESEAKATTESKEKTEIKSETYETMPAESNLYTVPGLPEHIYSVVPESGKLLRGGVYENAQDLKYQIQRAQAVTLTPSYSLLSQQLEDEFDLDYKQFGLQLAQNTKGNSNVFMQYNVIIYTSGSKTGLTNVTHEFRGGIQSRPKEKWEYRADLGVKVFEFNEGAMIISDSWIKHYFNDNFNLKAGYRRNNIEQSYLAGVGEFVDGVFTGRAADNKFYIEFEGKLPYGFYTFGRGAYGVIYAQNLLTNQYSEGMAGIGKLLYNNPKNKWINTFGVDLVTYNASYQYNLINIYNSVGKLFGGYFSPSFYNAETVNFKLEGDIKKWHLKYGVKGFGGIQTSMSPDSTTPTWGVAPYLAYDLNDHITFNISYSFYNYASVQRNLFMVNAVIRGFRKNAKN